MNGSYMSISFCFPVCGTALLMTTLRSILHLLSTVSVGGRHGAIDLVLLAIQTFAIGMRKEIKGTFKR